MVDIQQLNHIPDLLAIHQHKPNTYPYLLSSANCGGEHGRYSLLFAFPQQKISCTVDKPEEFTNLLDSIKPNNNKTKLPFSGGWFFYFSYEYAQCIETHLKLTTSDLPLAFAHRVPAGIVIDHQENVAYTFCEVEYKQYVNELLDDSRLSYSFDDAPTNKGEPYEEADDIYINAIKRTKTYIKEGDIFQANLSRLWQINLNQDETAAQYYYQLMQHNPSPFSALVTINDSTTLISSSPERLVKIKDGKAETRPIAGTHPRSESHAEDKLLSEKLLKHPKEQAEHIMLIDLERNDLGRFCVPGSIKVDEFMVLESYRHVHHIVSNVVGEIAQNTSLKDIIHAVFPGGTITGCPKVRCMEIINELEHSERACYTGSVGYINHNGEGDFNILIRTLLHTKNKITFRAGAGIVADSDPFNELEETRHKAKGMIRAFS